MFTLYYTARYEPCPFLLQNSSCTTSKQLLTYFKLTYQEYNYLQRKRLGAQLKVSACLNINKVHSQTHFILKDTVGLVTLIKLFKQLIDQRPYFRNTFAMWGNFITGIVMACSCELWIRISLQYGDFNTNHIFKKSNNFV